MRQPSLSSDGLRAFSQLRRRGLRPFSFLRRHEVDELVHVEFSVAIHVELVHQRRQIVFRELLPPQQLHRHAELVQVDLARVVRVDVVEDFPAARPKEQLRRLGLLVRFSSKHHGLGRGLGPALLPVRRDRRVRRGAVRSLREVFRTFRLFRPPRRLAVPFLDGGRRRRGRAVI